MTATNSAAPKVKSGPSFAEFVTVLSLMMSLTALSIDAMLPALADIGRDLGVENANDRQLVVTMIFLGLALGQMFFGPLSDKTGRKPAIYLGFVLYIIGSLISFAAMVFPVMLIGRFIMGLGASSARALTLALVRDRYEGRVMARVMSFVMTIFILVPIIAPTVGQAILLVADWRAIFLGLIVIALITWIWFAVRIPETLDSADRAPFSVGRIIYALGEIMKSRIALGYTISAGLIGGAFLGYISSAQQIFQELYGQGDRFPIIFGGIAISIGMASFSNTRLVMRYGMRPLINWSLTAITGLAVIALVVALITEGQPPLWFLLGYLLLSFYGVGILFGNQNAMAMEPLGHLAGIGAAVVGSVSTLIQMPLGTFIGQNYNGTVIPLVAGLAVLSAMCIVVIRWAEAGQE